ncbi:MAG: hypothetical protein H3C35_08380 [Bacteroidetes bacterium]|nr:hypothetical protein [Bacteroidota bacterium]
MKNRLFTYRLIVLYFVLMSCAVAQDINKTIVRTKEKEVTLKLESSFGTLNVKKGENNNVVAVQYKMGKEKSSNVELQYQLNGTSGDLRMELNPKGASKEKNGDVYLKDFDLERDTWYVFLHPEIEYDISTELGAGKSSFDFSNIKVTNLSISAGASSSKIFFDEPNKVIMKKLTVETGVSKFSADNLSNANFERMRFDGGVGSYYLNFGGTMNHDADVDINVGLGAVTIEVPKNIGAMVRYKDSWLSNITVGSGFEEQRKGVYKTENYSSAEGRLNIWVEASLGTVKIRQLR